MVYGDLCCRMVERAARAAAGGAKDGPDMRLPDCALGAASMLLPALESRSMTSRAWRACGCRGRNVQAAASAGDEPCRIMAQVPGKARWQAAVRAADANAQRPRPRSCARRRGMAGGFQRLRPAWLRPEREQRAGASPGQGCPCGMSRRADRSAGCGGTRAGGRGAGTGG